MNRNYISMQLNCNNYFTKLVNITLILIYKMNYLRLVIIIVIVIRILLGYLISTELQLSYIYMRSSVNLGICENNFSAL